MHKFSVETVNENYMFRLQSSHHQAVYIRSIRRNCIPVGYIELQIICGGVFGLTYKSICDSYT
jgi:hypothetical protein